MRNFARGLRDVWWAIAFLGTRPKLCLFLIAPAVTALVFAGGAVWLAWGFLDSSLTLLVQAFPSWLAWAGVVLQWLGFLLMLAAAYFLFFGVASIATGPFSEVLAERVELAVTGRRPEPFVMRVFVRDLAIGIAHATRRLWNYGVRMGALLVLAVFIPVVGPIAYVLGGLWLTVHAAAWDAVDCTLARKGCSYAQKAQFLRAHRARLLGIGCVSAGVLLVPLVNLIALPIGAVAAVHMYAQNQGIHPLPNGGAVVQEASL